MARSISSEKSVITIESMPLRRVKEPLPGVTSLASHRLVYRDVGEGLPYRRPLLRPCTLMSVLLTVVVAFVFKNF